MTRITRPIRRAIGAFHIGRILWRGVIIAAPMPPRGTPLCLTEKIRLRRLAGVKRISRCDAEGVIMP